MIDKLDVRIPCDTPFHPEFSKLYQELHYDSSNSPFRPSRHYLLVADLRPYGYQCILHMSCKRGKYGHHKLEVIDTGTHSFAYIVNEIERIFQIDALRLEVMRIDLAVDVKGVPVSWFQSRVKADHKQYIANFGHAEFVEMGKGGIQTLYFGKRPNLYRIYDKVAEFKAQYRKIVQQLGQDAPSFETLYGVPENGVTVTRVERQFGREVPEELATVAKLRKLEVYRPFEKLQIVIGGTGQPNPEHYSFMEFCTGMYLRQRAESDGMQATLRFIRDNSSRNTAWALEKFKDFLPEEHPDLRVNTFYLNELFAVSVGKQLAA